jgi:dephospho-CoA kinase
MLRVGLTGGIGTGKSYVLDHLRARGIACLDADAIAHGVLAAGTEATDAVAARFGDDVLAADGSVNRAKLGPLVFADAAARRDLEAIVHPAVYRSITAGLRAFELLGEHRLVVAAVPLLFETGHAKDFDRVIATVCAPPLQLTRLIERGLGEGEARQRIEAQLPAEEKAARSDFVIRTDGSFVDTDRQIDSILSVLVARRS